MKSARVEPQPNTYPIHSELIFGPNVRVIRIRTSEKCCISAIELLDKFRTSLGLAQVLDYGDWEEFYLGEGDLVVGAFGQAILGSRFMTLGFTMKKLAQTISLSMD